MHRIGSFEGFLDPIIQRKRLRVQDWGLIESHSFGLGDIEIVSERDPIAFRDFMLAVTVEGRPLDGCLTLGTSVKPDFLAMVLHGQITSFEGRWKANHQRTNLVFGAWGVNMLAEKAGWF